MSGLVAALDVGTTTVRMGLFDGDECVAEAARNLDLSVPFPGAAEHDAGDLLATVERLWAAVAERGDVGPNDVDALGIANQRATIVCWSSRTGVPLCPAVGWQDTRTADRVAELVAQGIPVTTSASCTKMGWLVGHDPAVAAAATDGTLRMGTIDTWLTWALSGGEAFITEPGNAAATGCYDAGTGDWSDGALALFGIPREPLAEVVASDETVGTARLGGVEIPLTGRLGDQMAACAAHHLSPGDAKLTLGTSAMLDVHAGVAPGPAPAGCYTLPLWRRRGVEEFLHEGSVNTAGSVVEWLVRVGLIDSVASLDAIASAGRPGAVAFVPALAGLGSPHHDPTARASWTGMGLDTTRADLVRGAVEGIAERVLELAAHMGVTAVALDGGLSRSRVLVDALTRGGLGVGEIMTEATLRGAAEIARR